MVHSNRVWCVDEVQSAEELAQKLVSYTWTLCTGFRYSGYLFLNDSFSEDGAQEYGVVNERTGKQVDTITVSWCSYEKLLQLVNKIAAGELDGEFADWNPKIDIKTQVQTPEEHGRCYLCM